MDVTRAAKVLQSQYRGHILRKRICRIVNEYISTINDIEQHVDLSTIPRILHRYVNFSSSPCIQTSQEQVHEIPLISGIYQDELELQLWATRTELRSRIAGSQS